MNVSATVPRQDNPGSQESGFSHFWGDRSLTATPKALFSGLLSSRAVSRVIRLMHGPQRPAREDRRLINLGLARTSLGKTVATEAARRCFFMSRYEVRQGDGYHGTAWVMEIEADNMAEAVRAVRERVIARVDEELRRQLVEAGDESFRQFAVYPTRTWSEWDISPLIIEVILLDDTVSVASLPHASHEIQNIRH
jgi:hypothetical protein